jgi:hypothetical protein
MGKEKSRRVIHLVVCVENLLLQHSTCYGHDLGFYVFIAFIASYMSSGTYSMPPDVSTTVLYMTCFFGASDPYYIKSCCLEVKHNRLNRDTRLFLSMKRHRINLT